MGERPGHCVRPHLNLTLFENRVSGAEVRPDEGGPKADSWRSDKERGLWKQRHTRQSRE